MYFTFLVCARLRKSVCLTPNLRKSFKNDEATKLKSELKKETKNAQTQSKGLLYK